MPYLDSTVSSENFKKIDNSRNLDDLRLVVQDVVDDLLGHRGEVADA